MVANFFLITDPTQTCGRAVGRAGQARPVITSCISKYSTHTSCLSDPNFFRQFSKREHGFTSKFALTVADRNLVTRAEHRNLVTRAAPNPLTHMTLTQVTHVPSDLSEWKTLLPDLLRCGATQVTLAK